MRHRHRCDCRSDSAELAGPRVDDFNAESRAITKPRQHVSMKPSLQLYPPAALRKQDQSPPDFTDSDHTKKEHFYRLRFGPPHDTWLRTIPAKFREDVGIELGGVRKSIGRPVDGLRLKSRFVPRNGAKSSSISFAGGFSGAGGGEYWRPAR